MSKRSCNERLYYLVIGRPYKLVSTKGEMNYRLRVLCNQKNTVPRNCRLVDPAAKGQYEYVYKTLQFVDMKQ